MKCDWLGQVLHLNATDPERIPDAQSFYSVYPQGRDTA